MCVCALCCTVHQPPISSSWWAAHSPEFTASSDPTGSACPPIFWRREGHIKTALSYYLHYVDYQILRVCQRSLPAALWWAQESVGGGGNLCIVCTVPPSSHILNQTSFYLTAVPYSTEEGGGGGKETFTGGGGGTPSESGKRRRRRRGRKLRQISLHGYRL